MKKLASILLLFVMCFALVGCGKNDEKENLEEKAKENVTALAKAAQQYFADRIKNGEGFVWEVDATQVSVAEKPTSGKVTFTPNPTGDVPIVTVTNAKFGDYSCTYENETANCTK